MTDDDRESDLDVQVALAGGALATICAVPSIATPHMITLHGT
jgi:hypothetical protein